MVNSCTGIHKTIRNLIKSNADALNDFKLGSLYEVPLIKYQYSIPDGMQDQYLNTTVYEFEASSINIKAILEAAETFAAQLSTVRPDSGERDEAVKELITYVQGFRKHYEGKLVVRDLIDNISYCRCFRNKQSGLHEGLMAVPDVFISNPHTNARGHHIDVPHLTFHMKRNGNQREKQLQCHAKLVSGGISYCPRNWDLKSDANGAWTATPEHTACSESLRDAMSNTLYILNTFGEKPQAAPVSFYSISRASTSTSESLPSTSESLPSTVPNTQNKRKRPPIIWNPVKTQKAGDTVSGPKLPLSNIPEPQQKQESKTTELQDDINYINYITDLNDIKEIKCITKTYTHAAELGEFVDVLLNYKGLRHVADDVNSHATDQIHICKLEGSTFIFFNPVETDVSDDSSGPDDTGDTISRGGGRPVFQFAGVAIGLAMTVACSFISSLRR